jgi:cysteine-rich repeat protein
MHSILKTGLAVTAALAMCGCNNLIGANEPDVFENPTGEDSDPEGGEAAGPCGNGVIDKGEECDDANAANADGCSACVVDCSAAPEFKDPSTAHCYRMEKDGAKTWDEAKAECGAWGGTLATLTSVDEFIVVQNRVREDTWIGGFDPAGEGSFQWVTDEPWVFESWASERPIADGHAACVLIEKELLRFWDAECDIPKGYVCERAPAGVPGM